MPWHPEPEFETRLETHGGRVVRCFVDRVPHAYALLSRSVERHPDRIAAVSDGQNLTFTQILAEVGRVAAGLQANGVGAGDRVGLLIGTSVEMTIAIFALWRIGAIGVPLDNRLLAAEIEHIMRDCAAAALILDADLRDHAPTFGTPSDLKLIVEVSTPTCTTQTALRFDTIGAGLAPAVEPVLEEEQDALIVYTSGTSGKPKGAVVSHFNLVHTVRHYDFAWRLGPDDRSMMAIPATNITGLAAIILTLMGAGGAVVYNRAFKAKDFLARAAQERITHAFMVPAMYKLCLLNAEFDQHDLSSWRLGSYGGAIMPPATIAEIADRLPNLRLMNGYGATETTSPSVMLPGDLTASHSDSVGFALPCTELCVMDANGREVPAGVAGELWIRGPQVIGRYWNNPEETALSFCSGYWRSSDICSIDEEGFVRFHDRLKDTINRGGFKIYSAEVENTLMQHPGVQELAVIGKPDTVLGERVHAVVMRRSPGVQEEELHAFCAARLADYKVPEGFTMKDEPLPRNANGKILKRVLRDQLFS